MKLSPHQDILQQVAEYLAGRLSPTDLEAWLLPAAWNVHKSGDPAVEKLAGKIQLKLAEFDRGHWTADELRHRLEEIVAECRAEQAGRREAT
jgi:hypothetical protein